MNFNRPSLCNGTVTGWKYCYYNSVRNNRNNQFGARFLVYRKVNNEDTYRLIKNSIHTEILGSNEMQAVDCIHIRLNSSEQFQIQQNDILGSCIIRNQAVNPLRVVGNTSKQSKGIYQANLESLRACNEIITESVNTNDLLFRSFLTLHLSVKIGKFDTAIALLLIIYYSYILITS